MEVLIIGGAGYIGSQMAKRLGQLGCRLTTLDNLSSGHRDAVLCGDFVQGDLADKALLADATLARQQLGWTPQFPDLETIVAHAWGWEQKIIGEKV